MSVCLAGAYVTTLKQEVKVQLFVTDIVECFSL